MQEVLRKKLVRAGDTFAVSAAILGKSLFLPIYRTNVVMEYDTLEETAQFHVLNEEVRLLHCTVNDESLWLLTEDSNTVLQWDKKEGIKDKIELIPQEDTDNFSGKIFGRMFSYENSLIILPRFSDIFSIVDLSSKTAKLQDLKGMGIQRIAGYNESNSLFWQGLVNENKLYLPPWSSEKLVIFELKSQIIHSVSMKRQEDDWKRIIAHTYQNRQVFYEREKMSLEDYLAILDEGKQ